MRLHRNKMLSEVRRAMNLTTRQGSIFLLSASLAIIAFDFGVFTAGSGSISFGFISIGDLQLKKPEVLVAILAFLLVLSIFAHVHSFTNPCADLYRDGYRNNTKLVEALRGFLIFNIGHNNVGSPTGNLSPGFRKKPIHLGIYTKVGGEQTPNLVFEIPNRIHRECILSGAICTIFSRSFFTLILGAGVGVFSVWRLIT